MLSDKDIREISQACIAILFLLLLPFIEIGIRVRSMLCRLHQKMKDFYN